MNACLCIWGQSDFTFVCCLKSLQVLLLLFCRRISYTNYAWIKSVFALLAVLFNVNMKELCKETIILFCHICVWIPEVWFNWLRFEIFQIIKCENTNPTLPLFASEGQYPSHHRHNNARYLLPVRLLLAAPPRVDAGLQLLQHRPAFGPPLLGRRGGAQGLHRVGAGVGGGGGQTTSSTHHSPPGVSFEKSGNGLCSERFSE